MLKEICFPSKFEDLLDPKLEYDFPYLKTIHKVNQNFFLVTL